MPEQTETTTTHDERRGIIFPGNPKRWRDAKQAKANKARKRRAALRKHRHNGLAPLIEAELKDLPPEVVAQLSRAAQEIYEKCRM